ncbi:MAG: aldehyde dehydrogenase family protein, partial [Desulfovibrionaceae bacterium]|nr:aldehyde dehydrogenase family protein [Desulfovibrionaceae bacterium]
MPEFLSVHEYENIAAKLSYPTLAFIGGEFTAAASGREMPSVNPATGRIIARVASCGAEDVERAVKTARKTFESGVWSRMRPAARKERILEFTSLLREHLIELAVLESVDSGKPLRDCLGSDVPGAIDCLEWHAEYADKTFGSLSPSGDEVVGMIVKEPAGVVACVLPWNFPLLMLAWKLGPALSEGNSVIIKPASSTSLTALKLAELAAEAGIPEGVIAVLPGPGGEVGEALGLHPDVDVLSFTGSTEVGRKFLEYSARSNLKRVVLELGGKSPFVILDDVDNFTAAAKHAAAAAFWNMGENCTQNSRVIVPEKSRAAFTEAFLGELSAWKTGNPLDPANALGAIVNKTQYDTELSYIEKGKAEGAELLMGGHPLQ